MDKRAKNLLTHAIGRDLVGLVEGYLIPRWVHLHKIRFAVSLRQIREGYFYEYKISRIEKKYLKKRDKILGFKHRTHFINSI